MPLKCPAPVSVQTLSADVFEVIRCDIDARTGAISVTWLESLAQATGPALFIRQVTKTLDGSTLGTARPDGTKSWRQNIKELLYRQLQDSKDIPAGILT